MKHYLDELAAHTEPTLPAVKDVVKDEDGPKKWFPHAEDFRADLERAFTLWDAVRMIYLPRRVTRIALTECQVYAAFSKAAELGLVVGKEEWDRVNEWAQERR